MVVVLSSEVQRPSQRAPIRRGQDRRDVAAGVGMPRRYRELGGGKQRPARDGGIVCFLRMRSRAPTPVVVGPCEQCERE